MMFVIMCGECRVPAELVANNNGACGDDECCGPWEEWYTARCPNCGQEERLEP